MKIGYDLTAARINTAGTGMYVKGLFNELRHTLRPDELIPFAFGPTIPAVQQRPIRRKINTLMRDVWWMGLELPIRARRSQVDLLHMPAFAAPVLSHLPFVVTILDLTNFHYKKYYRSWLHYYARLMIPLAVRKARHVLAISEFTKQDIVNTLGVASNKVTVTYVGINDSFQRLAKNAIVLSEIKQRYQLPERFVLAVGSLEPRKNLPRLLTAVGELQRDPALSGLQLVHIGPDGWLNQDIATTVEKLDLRSVVRFLGYLPEPDLAAIYNLASVLAYPSVFEGFGIPIVESMACGCPVITSSVSSMPEVAGDAAILVDPQSTEQLADALRRVLLEPNLAEELSFKGLTNARRFTWSNVAASTLNVYNSFSN